MENIPPSPTDKKKAPELSPQIREIVQKEIEEEKAKGYEFTQEEKEWMKGLEKEVVYKGSLGFAFGFGLSYLILKSMSWFAPGFKPRFRPKLFVTIGSGILGALTVSHW